LIEFNQNAKVLRRQAKETAIEAGIRIYLELMGRIPKREGLEDEPAIKAAARMLRENGEEVSWAGPGMSEQAEAGWGKMPGGESMADLLASWPMPEDEHADYGTNKVHGNGQMDGSLDESSEDSVAKQLRSNMAESQMLVDANGHQSSSSEADSKSDEEDSDVDMSDAP